MRGAAACCWPRSVSVRGCSRRACRCTGRRCARSLYGPGRQPRVGAADAGQPHLPRLDPGAWSQSSRRRRRCSVARRTRLPVQSALDVGRSHAREVTLHTVVPPAIAARTPPLGTAGVRGGLPLDCQRGKANSTLLLVAMNRLTRRPPRRHLHQPRPVDQAQQPTLPAATTPRPAQHRPVTRRHLGASGTSVCRMTFAGYSVDLDSTEPDWRRLMEWADSWRRATAHS